MGTTEVKEIWSEMLEALRAMLPEASFNTWFSNATIEHLADNRLVVGAANRFVKTWLENNYCPMISEAAKGVLGYEPQVEVVISKAQYKRQLSTSHSALTDEQTVSQENNAPTVVASPAAKSSALFSRSSHTFDTFIEGQSNSFACAAAKQVVAYPGEFSPLYLFGGHGLGKTHLAHAICHEFSRLNPTACVSCLSAESFVQMYTASFMNKRQADFRVRFEKCDLLIVEDVQGFGRGKKEASQKEMISVVESLLHRGKQVVFTADRVLHDIEGLDPMLSSRMAGGLQARLSDLDEDTRRTILLAKASGLGEQAVEYLLGNCVHGGVREIEGAVKTFAAMQKMSGDFLHPAQAGAHFSRINLRRDFSIDDVAMAVAEAFGSTVGDMRSKKRDAVSCRARRVALHLGRSLGCGSLSSLGAYFGGRKHSTVLNILKTAVVEDNPVYIQKLAQVLKVLQAPLDIKDLLRRQDTMFDDK